MDAQTDVMDALKAKIEIKGTLEDLQRISIFLDNNYITYAFAEAENHKTTLDEWEGSIDWPPEGFLDDLI